MSPGEHVVIVQDGEPVATLARSGQQRWPCKSGSAKDTAHWIAAGFDSPLEGAPQSVAFEEVCHSVAAILLGALGGLVAASIYRTAHRTT